MRGADDRDDALARARAAGPGTGSSCPGVPLGRPAVMPTRCPACTSPARRLVGAASAISSSVTSWRFIDAAWTPHISPQRRTVSRPGERARIGTFGRCALTSRARAARRASGRRARRGELARGDARGVGDGVGGVARVAVDARARSSARRAPRARSCVAIAAIISMASDRVRADGRLLGEHHRVGAVEDRVGDVGDLGARRARGGDHRVEHLRRGDRRARERAGQREQALLDHRHLLDRHLDAEVAAGDHHAVGRADDLLRALDGLGLLDLRDQRQCACARARSARPRACARSDSATMSTPIALAGAQVGEVLLGHRGQLVERARGCSGPGARRRCRRSRRARRSRRRPARTAVARRRTAPSAR